MTIKFRPHHFLCALCFQGSGYNAAFVTNFQNIMARLNAVDGDDTSITVVNTSDSICAPCPHRREATCTTAEKIQSLDASHAAALGLSANEHITWGEAKQRIESRLTLTKFHDICANCEWKSAGICEKVLKDRLAP